MNCPKCGAENREGSNYCRYCAFSLITKSADPTSGYIPSVPPPEATFQGYHSPVTAEPRPAPPAPRFEGPVCPRCGSFNVIKGGIPPWAIVTTILGFFVVCFFSFFFLLIKEPNRCTRCGLEFK